MKILKPLLLLRLFLKCKHTTGSGSGGAGHNCNSKETEKSHQLAVNLKAVLAELTERKEDFEKLKQKLERLEVSLALIVMNLQRTLTIPFLFQTTQKELADMGLALESERYRAERLEGQINDLTELHQVVITFQQF